MAHPYFYNIEIYNRLRPHRLELLAVRQAVFDNTRSRGNYGGGVNGTTSFTDLIIIPDSGTIDGYIKVYGYQNS
jgi:hypothetical protein